MSKHQQKKSAPKPGSADHPSPSEFKVVHHPGADMKNKGEWLGHLEAVPTKIPVVKILKEIQRNAK